MIWKAIGIGVAIVATLAGWVAVAYVLSDPRRTKDFKNWMGIE